MKISVNGAKLFYQDTGQGRETILFMHGLGMSGHMFSQQIAELSDRYRCVTFDLRGHGGSELTEKGYDMDSMAGDAAALIEKLGTGPVHFIGFSIGGFAGLRIALHQPRLLRSLILIGAASINGKSTSSRFKMVPFLSRVFGMRLIAGSMMKSNFSPNFLEDQSRRPERDEWHARIRANRGLGISRMANGVIAQTCVLDQLGHIHVPVLVIRGQFDALVKEEVAKKTVDAIIGAQFVTIPNGGHACNIDEPVATNAALIGFLNGLSE